MGGDPIGVGEITPLFEAKEDGGHISYLTYCSYHAFTLMSTPCRLYPGVWAVAHHAID